MDSEKERAVMQALNKEYAIEVILWVYLQSACLTTMSVLMWADSVLVSYWQMTEDSQKTDAHSSEGNCFIGQRMRRQGKDDLIGFETNINPSII